MLAVLMVPCATFSPLCPRTVWSVLAFLRETPSRTRSFPSPARPSVSVFLADKPSVDSPILCVHLYFPLTPLPPLVSIQHAQPAVCSTSTRIFPGDNPILETPLSPGFYSTLLWLSPRGQGLSRSLGELLRPSPTCKTGCGPSGFFPCLPEIQRPLHAADSTCPPLTSISLPLSEHPTGITGISNSMCPKETL